MIALLVFSALSILLIAGFAWASTLSGLGSHKTPPSNQATMFFANFGRLFREWGPLAGVLALMLFGLNWVAAHYGSLMAVALMLCLFTLPTLFYSPKLGAATTVARDTKSRPGELANYPMAAATTIPLGALVALDASGNAVNASDTAALRVVGRAEQTVNNASGSAGDLTINVARGVFLWGNSATQAVTAAYKDKYVYVEDNQTVAISTTNFIIAGKVIEVATEGVWVDTRDKGPVNAKVVTTVGAALADLTGGESPTEAEHNTAIARINALRVDVLAIAAKLNAG